MIHRNEGVFRRNVSNPSMNIVSNQLSELDVQLHLERGAVRML